MRSPLWRRAQGVVVVALLCAASLAWGDRIEALTTSLLSDPSWRVRVQAAITLGKMKTRERRAVQALKEALKDDNDGVRAVAAETLGKVGDPSARDALVAASNDSEPAVAASAKKAIEAIDHPAPEEATGGGGGGGGGNNGPVHWYIEVSGFSSKVAGPEAVKKVHDRALRSLGEISGVTLDPAAAGTRARYYLDGNLSTLKTSPPGPGGQVRTECMVNITLSTLPSKSIKFFGSAGAIVPGTADPKDIEGAQELCLVEAGKQIAEKVQPFL